MAKAASCNTHQEVLKNTCPWEMFLAAFTTITPPSARYAITNNGRMAVSAKPLCSMISPATKEDRADDNTDRVDLFFEKDFFAGWVSFGCSCL